MKVYTGDGRTPAQSHRPSVQMGVFLLNLWVWILQDFIIRLIIIKNQQYDRLLLCRSMTPPSLTNAQGKSQPTVTWYPQTLQSNKEAAWQFWLQLSWAETSHETHLTPDKSMDTTAHTNPLAGQSTPINGNKQTWGASGSTVKTWECPPRLHGPHSLRSFYIIRITGPSTIKDRERGWGTMMHTIQSNHVNTMKFQTQDHSPLIAISMKKFYNSST